MNPPSPSSVRSPLPSGSPSAPPQLLDISRRLTPGHPNWPGDAPYTLTPGAQLTQGDSVNTSVLSCSTHTGTHVDAPWHYAAQGARLSEVPLERYAGRARLRRVPGEGTVGVSAHELFGEDAPAIWLLMTGEPAHWTHFPQTFRALDPAFVEAAARAGVRLLGTDAPSVDPLISRELPAHRACLAADILILESLNLAGVPEGDYDLLALPLPLEGADASPVRAVLLPAGALSGRGPGVQAPDIEGTGDQA